MNGLSKTEHERRSVQERNEGNVKEIAYSEYVNQSVPTKATSNVLADRSKNSTVVDKLSNRKLPTGRQQQFKSRTEKRLEVNTEVNKKSKKSMSAIRDDLKPKELPSARNPLESDHYEKSSLIKSID